MEGEIRLEDTSKTYEGLESYQTPSSIISAFNSALQVPMEQKTLKLRGVYIQGRSPSYGDFFYDKLEDEFSKDFITLRVPTKIRAVMITGAIYTVFGFVERKVKGDKGCIECHFRITNLVGKEEAKADPEAETRLEVISQATKRPIINPEQILRNILATGRKPHIAFIYGEAGIVDRDVMAALGTASVHYEVTDYRECFSDPVKISKILQSLDTGIFDQIAIVRGGGPGLEVFEDLSLAKIAVELKTPLLVALGHEQDHPFIEKVACRSLPTPTALGHWLKNVVEDTYEGRSNSIARLREELEKQNVERINCLEKSNLEKQNIIDGLRKKLDARVDIEDDVNKELYYLRGQTNNQASEINHLKLMKGKGISPWWIGFTLVNGLLLGILIAIIMSF